MTQGRKLWYFLTNAINFWISPRWFKNAKGLTLNYESLNIKVMVFCSYKGFLCPCRAHIKIILIGVSYIHLVPEPGIQGSLINHH